MKPEKGDRVIRVPVTFDYSGGRSENVLIKVAISAILMFLTVGYIILYWVRGDVGFLIKILVSLIVLYVSLFVLRFFILREHMYSKAYEYLVDKDFEPSLRSIWGIFECEDRYPHICHFENGRKGVFVRMEKDVIIGKDYDTSLNDHYNAISSAYNVASSLKLDVRHVDYMDFIGRDERIGILYGNLESCSNPDLKGLMIDIFSNLENVMYESYTSYDVYCFTADSEEDLLNVQEVLNEFMSGNYLTYKVLDLDGLRNLSTALFSLTEFSAYNACKEVLVSKTAFSGIVPISVHKSDGTVEKINKTIEEKRLEQEQIALQAEEAKIKKRRKRGKKTISKEAEGINKDTEINIL